MAIMKEFREFAVRGNVVDMAIGIIVGGAFATIVKSLVADVLMPPIGLLLGGVDFADLYVLLKPGAEVPGPYASLPEAQAAGAVTVNVGVFLNNVISFVILAFAVFLLVRSMNALRRRQEAPAAPTTKACERCFTKIPVQATRCPACTSELTA